MEDWERFEEHVNEVLGLDATVASGSQYHDLGDGTNRNMYDSNPFRLIVDAKCTARGSFTLKASFFHGWIYKGMELGKRFAMPIRFLASSKTPQVDVVVVELNDFAELLMLAKRGAERE